MFAVCTKYDAVDGTYKYKKTQKHLFSYTQYLSKIIKGDSVMEMSKITNCWGTASTKQLDAEHFEVFKGRAGCAYNHQHQLASIGDRLFITWSNGNRDEEGPGQRVAMSISDDLGQTWSQPVFIANTALGEHATRVMASTGIHVAGDTLIAYYGEFEYRVNGLEEDGSRKPWPPYDI